ncbi:MAG: molybdopterin-dependent oxidoreductase [Gemmataceae bacterium]
MMNLSRRKLLMLGVAAAGSQILPQSLLAEPEPAAPTAPPPDLAGLPFLRKGSGPYRGIARSLKGDELIKARLTPETWQVEIIGDGVALEKPRKFDNGSALDYATLVDLGKKHSVKVLKAMQCSTPLSNHAVWEGVPLREVVRLLGKVGDFQRINISGFHDPSNPQSHFHSVSASYAHVMENDPGDPPIIVAYRLNGAPIPQARGGPVRVIVPWAYGFRSVKSLQRLVLTSDPKPVNTYFKRSPDTNYVMTIAWPEGPFEFKSGRAITIRGMTVCGKEGLKGVEYWLRPDTGEEGRLREDDPAWKTATWQPCVLEPPPQDWKAHLPAGVSSKELWGFDPETGQPKEWPVRYSVGMWTAPLKDLKPGTYELRVRAVDQSGRAQPALPQNRDRAKSQNSIKCRIIKVT